MGEVTKVVYFHKNCADGVAAAGVCFLAFGNSAEYIPIEYYDKPDFTICKDKEVYFVDFFPNKLMWSALREQRPNTVLVFDHHESAFKQFNLLKEEGFFTKEEAERILFSSACSGAKLVWQCFYPKKTSAVIEAISDADLFTFKLPNSKELSLAMRYLAGNSPAIAAKVIEQEYKLDHLYQAGFGIVSALQEQEEIVCSLAHEVTILGTKGLIVNATNNLFKTNVGNILAKQSGTFGAVYDIFLTEGRFLAKISFRGLQATEDFAGTEVLSIAESLGGGGHLYAASAIIPLEDLILLLENKL